MPIRLIKPDDVPAWISLRSKLWPDESAGELDVQGRAALKGKPQLEVFIAEEQGMVIGFLELSLRSYAEGCESSPAPYVEGWYVEPAWRLGGIGTDLLNAAIDWCRTRGYTELGSDTEATSRLSRDVHAALGFDEVATLVVFRKTL